LPAGRLESRGGPRQGLFPGRGAQVSALPDQRLGQTAKPVVHGHHYMYRAYDLWAATNSLIRPRPSFSSSSDCV